MIKKLSIVILIAASVIASSWYCSLYHLNQWDHPRVVEDKIQLNRCDLAIESWLVRAARLYRNTDGLYLANGRIEDPKTKLWKLDTQTLNCQELAQVNYPSDLELVKSSYPNGQALKAYDPIAPLFSNGFIVEESKISEDLLARRSFSGKHIRRPEYRFSLMAGKFRWELNSSYIGRFSLELYKGDQRIIVLDRSVYGATWAPTISDNTVNWDPINRIIVIFDEPPKTGVFYWAQLKN